MTKIIVWEEISIEVSSQCNWPIEGTHHLELRAAVPLPVTSTGYRSAFLATDAIRRFPTLEDYVLAWLDEAAKAKSWLKQKEDARQMSLF